MKRCLIVLALLVAGCAANSTTQTGTTAPENSAPTLAANQSTAQATASNNGPDVAPKAQDAGQTIPQGARFTIFCESFTGDDHVQRSTAVKEVLMRSAATKGWYVIHQSDQSTIYHGYYREFDASATTDAAGKKEAERAQREKKLVEAVPNPLKPDSRLFTRAIFVSLDSPDPDAPAEWNLVNTHGYWSVEIATYSGFERKQAAVESVREARKLNIPAYYYHGASYSSVCIGAWPQAAVIEHSTEQVNSIRADSDVFVDVRGGGISPEMRDQLLKSGKNVQVVVPKVQVVDKSLLDTLRAYPEHAVDGYTEMETIEDPATKKQSQRPKHSMLVRVPASSGQSASEGADTAPTPAMIRPNQSNNLGARLRGLNP